MQLKIPVSVRSAALSVLIGHGVRELGLAEEFLQREGFGSFQDVVVGSASITATPRRTEWTRA